MTEPLDSDKLDGRLWRQFSSQAQKPQAPQIDPNDLAAYLDASADPEQVELVEARLADDPDFLAEVTDLRRISQLEALRVPASVLTRARSLGHRRLWPMRIRWAAAAATILLACLIGYSAAGASQRAHDYTQVAAQMSDLLSDPSFGIILPFNGSDGR